MRWHLAWALTVATCTSTAFAVPHQAPRARRQTIDLGTIHAPAGAPDDHAVRAAWRVDERGPTYRLTLVMSDEETIAAQQPLYAYARAVGYRPDPRGGSFQQLDDGCGNSLRCVYEHLLRERDPYVDAVAERFAALEESAHLTREALAAVVIAYVQSLAYRVPQTPFGILPPGLAAFRGWGDCDSRVLLAVALLRRLGTDAAILESNAANHVMLAVDLPTDGATVTCDGRLFAVVEMTSAWRVGDVPARNRNLSWAVFSFPATRELNGAREVATMHDDASHEDRDDDEPLPPAFHASQVWH